MKKQLILFSSLLLIGTVAALNTLEQVQAAQAEPAIAVNNRAEKVQEKFYADGIYYAIKNEAEVSVSNHGFNALPEVLVIPDKVTDAKTGTTYSVVSVENSALALGSQNEIQETALLKKVTLPNTIKTLPNGLFNKQTKLEEVILPNKLEAIGPNAFLKTASLKKISLPNTLKSIGSSAFEGTGLESLVIPESVTTIDQVAFRESALKTMALPAGLTKISLGLFQDSQSLQTVTIPNSVTTIEDKAFSGTGLISVKLPTSLKEIRISVFENSHALTSVTIPDSVTKIWDNAFTGTRITELRMPKGLTIWNGFGANAIAIDSLEKITFTTPIDGGLHATAIKAPSKKGFIFDGWVADGVTYTHEQLTSVAIAGNKTATAKWKSTTPSPEPTPSKGQSDATITLRSKQPTGSLSFGDVKTDAKIVFNELTLNGKVQTTTENSAITKANVIVNDTRSDKKLGWKVSAKYGDTNFSSKKMLLALNPTPSNTTGLKNITLTNTDLELFNDGGQTNEKYTVVLKPELTIPADLDVASEMKTQIQWTLIPEVP